MSGHRRVPLSADGMKQNLWNYPVPDSKLLDVVETAIFDACEYALPPHLLRASASAAIEAVKQHFIEAAKASKFASDRAALFAAVEEIEDALK